MSYPVYRPITRRNPLPSDGFDPAVLASLKAEKRAALATRGPLGVRSFHPIGGDLLVEREPEATVELTLAPVTPEAGWSTPAKVAGLVGLGVALVVAAKYLWPGV